MWAPFTMICLSMEAVMGDSDKTTSNTEPPVKHDWTFFVFITAALILIATGICWVSTKSTFLTQVDNNAQDSTTIDQSAP